MKFKREAKKFPLNVQVYKLPIPHEGYGAEDGELLFYKQLTLKNANLCHKRDRDYFWIQNLSILSIQVDNTLFLCSGLVSLDFRYYCMYLMSE